MIAAAVTGAGAATVTWNGPAGNSWGSGASWSNGSGPAAGDTALFGDAGSTNLPGEVTSVLNGSRTMGGLTFSNTINKYHTLDLATHGLTVAGNFNVNVDQSVTTTTIRNGALSVGGPFANINVGRAVAGSANGTADLTGLTSFTANVQEVNVATSTGGAATGVLRLAPSNNLTANTRVTVGGAGASGGDGTLNLGLVNTITTPEFVIARDHANALVDIPSNGTFHLGTASARPVLRVADQTHTSNNTYRGRMLMGNAGLVWNLDSLVVAQKQGDRERAIRFYQAAAPAGERSLEARALANLGSLYAESGDFELALEHLTRALQAFSRLGGAREVAHAASNLARLHAFLGDLPRAMELSDHALKRAAEIGERYLQASALLNLGEAHLDKRELQDAVRVLGEARAQFEEVGNDGYAALAAAQKARAHVLLGERAQAAAELGRRCVEKGCAELAAALVETELVRGDLALLLGDLHGASRATTRAREGLLHKPDLEGPYRVYFLMGKLRLAAGDASGAQAEMARAARLMDELTQRVPPARRQAFLSIPRRAEVLGAVEPELRLPRLTQAAALRPEASVTGLVGRSAALHRITRQIEPIARSNTTVLIRGESGTGKELLAQAIHDLSPRRGMPMVKVNCAAMVEELLLSELFGHEKGAFTGAIRERKGRFEMADGGTLFLDEIGDISPKCQVALLRVLQERELERVGGTRTIKVDVRVICATNRDLEALIAQGRFRQDLYYRLKGVMLELPALRERLEDLPTLAQHFLTRIARERNEPVKQLSGEALELLARHSWPGNVRELENVLASAAIFADGTVITPDCFAHLPELVGTAAGTLSGTTSAAPTRAVEPARIAAPVAVAAPVASAPVTDKPRASNDDGDDDEEASSSGASVDDIDFYELARTRDMSLKDLRRQLEMQCIRRALLEARGNISEAARLLKMKRSRLSQIVNAEPELKGVCHGDE